MLSWHRGFATLDMALYYDATGDDQVLPELRYRAIEVAMAFAVSWNPLVKSKASAVITTRAKSMNSGVTFIMVSPSPAPGNLVCFRIFPAPDTSGWRAVHPA